MKKIYLSLIIFMGSCFMLSCTEFLEENPQDRFVIDNFYSSKTDAEAAVAAVYQQLYSIYERHMYLLWRTPHRCGEERFGHAQPVSAKPGIFKAYFRKSVYQGDVAKELLRNCPGQYCHHQYS